MPRHENSNKKIFSLQIDGDISSIAKLLGNTRPPPPPPFGRNPSGQGLTTLNIGHKQASVYTSRKPHADRHLLCHWGDYSTQPQSRQSGDADCIKHSPVLKNPIFMPCKHRLF